MILAAPEYLSCVPHCGYRVSTLGVEDLTEVVRLRGILQEALLNDAILHMTDAVVEEL